MGMESYFVQVLPNGVVAIKIGDCNSFQGHSLLSVDNFIKELAEKVSLQKNGDCQFSVDEVLQLTIGSEGSFIQEITIEGCFAWYRESIDLCYSLVRNIDDILGGVKLYHPIGMSFELSTKEDFLNEIMSRYSQKYDAFGRQFGDIRAKVLPGTPFFDMYEKSRRKGIFRKIFDRKK